MRLSAPPFFSSRSSGLVVVGEDEALVLDCYRLARFYHVNPETFLNMPISVSHKHLINTVKLAEQMKREAEIEAEDAR